MSSQKQQATQTAQPTTTAQPTAPQQPTSAGQTPPPQPLSGGSGVSLIPMLSLFVAGAIALVVMFFALKGVEDKNAAGTQQAINGNAETLKKLNDNFGTVFLDENGQPKPVVATLDTESKELLKKACKGTAPGTASSPMAAGPASAGAKTPAKPTRATPQIKRDTPAELVDQLRNGSTTAGNELVNYGDEAVTALIAAMADAKIGKQVQAYLVAIGQPAVKPAIAEFCNSNAAVVDAATTVVAAVDTQETRELLAETAKSDLRDRVKQAIRETRSKMIKARFPTAAGR